MTNLEEIDQQLENIKSLIRIRRKGLQKLKEREAQHGLDVPVSLSNEIEMFEAALEELQAEQAQLEQKKRTLEPPLVHIMTFGAVEKDLPRHLPTLEWSNYFDRNVTPRKVPPPELWEKRLWADLENLRDEKFRQRGPIQLQGTIALSAGFAFGHIFSQVGQYRLIVTQGPQRWRSDEGPDVTRPVFIDHEFSGDASAEDIVVIVNALPKQENSDLVSEIQSYMKNSGGFKRLLLLEAIEATQHGQFLQSQDAAVMARASRSQLRRFVKQNPARRLHIFLAAPAGLAIFLGHQWNAIGITAQVHEWAGVTGQYLPSCKVDLN